MSLSSDPDVETSVHNPYCKRPISVQYTSHISHLHITNYNSILYTVRCTWSYFDLLMGLGGFPLVFPFTLDLVGVPSTSNSSSTRLSMVTLATCTLPSRVNLSTLSPSTTGSLPDFRTKNVKFDVFFSFQNSVLFQSKQNYGS